MMYRCSGWWGLSVCILMLGCGSRPQPLDGARSLLFKKKYAEAVAECDKVLASAPHDLQAWLLRGQINHQSGKLDEALADFNKAIELAPANPEAYYLRAKLHETRGDLEAQLADDRRARELDVDYQLAYPIEHRPAPPSSSLVRTESELLASDEDPANEEDVKAEPLESPEGNDDLADQTASDSTEAESTPFRFSRPPASSIANLPHFDPSAASPLRQSLDAIYDQLEQGQNPRALDDLDLKDVVSDPIAPESPQLDPPQEEQHNQLPEGRITRFGFQPGELPWTITGRAGATTGLRSSGPPEQPLPRRGRFFLQGDGQIGRTAVRLPSAPTTGVRSEAVGAGPPRTRTATTKQGVPRLPTFQGGQLPFGPRLAQPGSSTTGPPVLTMALPGTANPTTALPSQAGSSLPLDAPTLPPPASTGVLRER